MADRGEAQARRTGDPSDRCPQCGATSGVAPDEEGGHRCLVCGTPRILVTEPVERPGNELPLLHSVQRLRARRAAWAVGSTVVGGLGALMILLAAVVWLIADLGFVGSIALGAMVLAPLLFAFYGWRRALASSEEARQKLREARSVVASEIVAARGRALEPPEIARLLGVSDDESLELYAQSQVSGLLDAGAPRARVRVDDSASMEAESAEEHEVQRTLKSRL